MFTIIKKRFINTNSIKINKKHTFPKSFSYRTYSKLIKFDCVNKNNILSSINTTFQTKKYQKLMDIQYTKVDTSILNTKDHCTGHVYLMSKYNNCYYVVMGHNKLRNYCTSFGGFKNSSSETLMDTICREFSEETLNCLINNHDLKKYLSKSTIITRKSPKGQHYISFSIIPNAIFDIKKIDTNFKQLLKNPNLTTDEQENDYLTLIPLVNIQNALMKKININDFIVKDYLNHDVKIRDISVTVFEWIFDNFPLYRLPFSLR